MGEVRVDGARAKTAPRRQATSHTDPERGRGGPRRREGLGGAGLHQILYGETGV